MAAISSSLVDDDAKGLAAHRAFYDEYFAVMDLPAPFYLQTVERIFQKHELARGVLVSRGRKVEPAAIRRTALLTVEGENDDICAVGQTLAAQELCNRPAPAATKPTICKPASAITACSAAAAGPPKCIRASAR